MNASPPIIKGIEETVRVPLPLVGAGLVGTYTFDPPRQFCGFSVLSQNLTGAVVRGKLYPYTAIMHGCTPKDGIYHTITKIEGPVVFELDNKPIVQAINEAYGSSSWKKQMPVKLLTLGINYGERYGAFNESNYVNRLIVGTLPDDLGVVLFEPDLHCGTEIQFMLRDGRKMIETARKNTRKLVEQIMNDGKKPCFGLYIDCAGRTAEYSDTLSEEAAEVQKILNEYQTPLLGFYSGVEIAPMLGKNRGLDWTGVLHILATD
jgi:small ligand-binding sensory domain FIST